MLHTKRSEFWASLAWKITCMVCAPKSDEFSQVVIPQTKILLFGGNKLKCNVLSLLCDTFDSDLENPVE